MAEEARPTSPPYGVCRTCGRYVSAHLMESGGYCSQLCAMSFDQCITCGRHVPRGALEDKYFCSPECAEQYRFLKTMGPRPVVVASDQSPTDGDDLLI